MTRATSLVARSSNSAWRVATTQRHQRATMRRLATPPLPALSALSRGAGRGHGRLLSQGQGRRQEEGAFAGWAGAYQHTGWSARPAPHSSGHTISPAKLPCALGGSGETARGSGVARRRAHTRVHTHPCWYVCSLAHTHAHALTHAHLHAHAAGLGHGRLFPGQGRGQGGRGGRP